MSKIMDLTGEKFGKLTVEQYAFSKQGQRYWKCHCDCGATEVFVSTSRLKSGGTHSCGCLLKQRSGINHPNFKGNTYEDCNEYMIGCDSKGHQFKIDTVDYESCRHYCWTATTRASAKGKYFCSRMSRKSSCGHRMKMLHNFIWELHNGNIPEGFLVDHFNQDPSDCRLSNLRLADKSLNAINCGIRSNNVSGITGVCRDKHGWRAFINYKGQRIELGYRKDKKEAVCLRLQAELKYYGKDSAPQRHLFESYGIEVAQ